VGDGHRRAAVPTPRGGGPDLSRRRTPTRLPGLIDSHAHLQHERFDGDRELVIQRAVEAGIERILVPGWDLPSSEAALELARHHRGLIDAAVGVHPHHAAEMDEAAWTRLEQLAADPGTRAIGEVGLDHYRNLSPPDVQREVLERQLALAATHRLPVAVHDRDAHDEILDALQSWVDGGPGRRGILHAYSGDAPMAERLRIAGFLVSFALPVAFRSAAGPRAAARAAVSGTFLVETDSPYLGPDRDGRNEPTTALRVVAELARLRDEEAEVIASDVGRGYRALIDESG
jgi:TatD DNase family protein